VNVANNSDIELSLKKLETVTKVIPVVKEIFTKDRAEKDDLIRKCIDIISTELDFIKGSRDHNS
jgi:hypothetical protein